MSNQAMNVDEAQLLQAKSDVETAVDTIKGLINAATGDVENMKPGWKGDAANKFAGVAADWEVESHKVNGLLDQIKMALGDTHAKTTQTEEENTQQLNM